MKCLNCREKEAIVKFCSRSCACSYNNQQGKVRGSRKFGPTSKRTCRECGCLIAKGITHVYYCSDNCFLIGNKKARARLLENKRNNRNHLEILENNRLRRVKGEEARQIYFSVYEHECVVCNYDKVVDVHHINKTEGNKILNLVGLCKNHHTELHRKIMSIEDMKKLTDRKLLK